MAMTLPVTGKELFLLGFGASFLIVAICWLVFARLSMTRIERSITHDGLDRPCPWDGLGARAIWYACAVGLPVGPWNPSNDPLIDVPLVRRYASPMDRKLGLAFVFSGGIFLVLLLIGIVFVGGPE